jgi:TRAP-type C4-dicarboxylate transport system substrate-binding protein
MSKPTLCNRVVASFAGIVMGAVLSAPASQAETVEMRMSLVVPPTHVIAAGQFVPWGQDVEKATEGRVKFRLLPKAVSGPGQQLDSIRQGIADVAFIAHGWTPGRFPITEVTEMPLLGTTTEIGSIAYQRIYDRYLAERVDKISGVVTLAVYTNGPAHIYNTKRPILKVADMEGFKFRAAAGGNAEIAKLLGVTAVPRPAPATYELLSSGVVDGVFLPHDGACLYRIPEAAKFASIVPGGLFSASVAAVMNPAKFNKLEKRDQEAITRLSGEAFARRAGRAWDEANDKCLEEMRKAGMRIDTVDSAFLDDVRRRTGSFEEAWAGQMKSAGIDGGKLLAELRAEIRKLTK